ncbi:MAG: P-type conjugative transfer protein TrbJ [Pseudomonadota bacterium]
MKKIFLLFVILALFLSTPVRAGIPVIDVGNLLENIISAIEAIFQTAKQIEQYETQLQQYEDQIKNTLSPETYIWDEAQSTISGLIDTVDTLSKFKAQLGSIDAYLEKFQDIDYYRNSPCFTAQGCSALEMDALNKVRALGSESQKKANDALMKGIDSQQKALKSDAKKLESLQQSAQNAEGRMEAIQAANQIASQEANQLLQIRGILLAQQNALAARNQTVMDKEAQEVAAGQRFRSGNLTPSTPKSWTVDGPK